MFKKYENAIWFRFRLFVSNYDVKVVKNVYYKYKNANRKIKFSLI